MELNIAVKLIKKGISQNTRQHWADLGAGSGLFTKALASLLPKESKIYAVDKNRALNYNEEISGVVQVVKITRDFTDLPLPIPLLDGIMMANSLHFVFDKAQFIDGIRRSLKNESRMVIVEYDMIKSNSWVPYPVGFETLQKLFFDCGFRDVKKLHEEPSTYNRSNIYSALIQ